MGGGRGGRLARTRNINYVFVLKRKKSHKRASKAVCKLVHLVSTCCYTHHMLVPEYRDIRIAVFAVRVIHK